MKTKLTKLIILIPIALLTLNLKSCNSKNESNNNNITKTQYDHLIGLIQNNKLEIDKTTTTSKQAIKSTKESIESKEVIQSIKTPTQLTNENIKETPSTPYYVNYVENENKAIRNAMAKYNIDNIENVSFHKCKFDNQAPFYSKEALKEHLCKENIHAIYSSNTLRLLVDDRNGGLERIQLHYDYDPTTHRDDYYSIYENKEECYKYKKFSLRYSLKRAY